MKQWKNEIQTKLTMNADAQIRAFVIRNNLILNRDFLHKAQIGVYVLSRFLNSEIQIDDITRQRLLTGIFWYERQKQEVRI